MAQFSPNCYAIIGVLIEYPNTVFKATEKRIADRMVKYGWLTPITVKVPQSIGAFSYETNGFGYFPTQAGLDRYNDLNRLVDKTEKIEKIKRAIKCEECKKMLEESLYKPAIVERKKRAEDKKFERLAKRQRQQTTIHTSVDREFLKALENL